jgi:MFS superfamily sulfate permease-like transporter
LVPADIFFLWSIRAKKELFLLFVTFSLTVVLGIELGIAISLLISVFLIIKQTTFPNINVLGQIDGTQDFREVTKNAAKTIPGILIVRIEEPLYFANVAQIKRLFARIEKLGDPKAHPSERASPFSSPNFQ